MKCANCDTHAMFIYDLSSTRGIPYCEAHLPSFLNARKNAGLLRTAEAFDTEKASALEALRAVHTPVDLPVEEPPVKATIKKKAASKQGK